MILLETYTESGGYYRFRFADIPMHKLGDVITSTLCAVSGGGVVNGESRTYSVKEYCYSMLAKNRGEGTLAFRKLLVDLLSYGTACQMAENYGADSLINAGLTAEHAALVTADPSQASADACRKAYLASLTAYGK